MMKIEDHALLSDCRTAALVSREGIIDWLCLPRFDSPSCFAALVGESKDGYWSLLPQTKFQIQRRYRPDTLILETEFVCAEGRVRMTDAFIKGSRTPLLVRCLRGLEGRVRLSTEILFNFDYASEAPWLKTMDYGYAAIAGRDAVHVQSPLALHERSDGALVANFSIEAGENIHFAMAYSQEFKFNYQPRNDFEELLHRTEQYWQRYSAKCIYKGPYREAVLRSVLTLQALTYEPSGGIVAAPTTSLPEAIGYARNWDYRYSWVRDSTFALYAFLISGYKAEARKWQQWLLRSVAGTPERVNIMYGVGGERKLDEHILPWLKGYENSVPVRVGNAAYKQIQLDVFGEVMDTLNLAHKSGIPIEEDVWRVQTSFLDFVEKNWRRPDEGIWEMRGSKRHFVHSKVMAWVAFDRAIQCVRRAGRDIPVDHWCKVRDEIHHDVCTHGFHEKNKTFAQSYGSDNLDAALLMIPMVGFLPPEDPRVQGTVAAIERELYHDGFVRRYNNRETADGERGTEGHFLACSFWLADVWTLMGRNREARALFEKLLTLRNDLGLLSEEYDSQNQRMLGNFPQALSHIAIVNTAHNLLGGQSPARDRAQKRS